MGGIGDMVFSTVFYDNYVKKFQDTVVHVIAPRTLARFVERNFPCQNKVVPFPVAGFRLNFRTEWQFFRKLYIENYDAYYCVIDYMCPTRIPHNLLGSFIGFTADIPLRYGLYRQNNKGLFSFEKQLLHYVFERKTCYTRHGFLSQGDHLASAPLKLLEFVDINPKVPDYRLRPDPSQEEKIDRLLSPFVGSNQLLVLINPTTHMRFKQWPHKRFAELADRLVDTFGAALIVNGSRDEKIGRYLSLLMRHPFLDLSGENALSISQLVTVAHKSHICIGLDSGPTHIAIAVSTPTIILYCSSPAGMSKPLDRRLHRVVETPERPCGTSCFGQACWVETPCSEFLTVDAVFNAFVDIVSTRYPERMVQ